MPQEADERDRRQRGQLFAKYEQDTRCVPGHEHARQGEQREINNKRFSLLKTRFQILVIITAEDCFMLHGISITWSIFCVEERLCALDILRSARLRAWHRGLLLQRLASTLSLRNGHDIYTSDRQMDGRDFLLAVEARQFGEGCIESMHTGTASPSHSPVLPPTHPVRIGALPSRRRPARICPRWSQQR